MGKRKPIELLPTEELFVSTTKLWCELNQASPAWTSAALVFAKKMFLAEWDLSFMLRQMWLARKGQGASAFMFPDWQ